MAKKQKRSQQDATLRNIRASRRREESIGVRLHNLETAVGNLRRQFEELLHGIRSGLSKI